MTDIPVRPCGRTGNQRNRGWIVGAAPLRGGDKWGGKGASGVHRLGEALLRLIASVGDFTASERRCSD